MFLDRYNYNKSKKSFLDLNPHEDRDYLDFIDNIKKYNFELLNTKCICGKNNDELFSSIDRHGCFFETVICINCGLIRAKKYPDRNQLINFYAKYYNVITSRKNLSSEELYLEMSSHPITKKRWEIIEKHINFSEDKKIDIIDIGGGGGGFLDKHLKKNNCFLTEYDESLISFAKSKGVKTIKGGIEDVVKTSNTFDLIILNHVVEHWNDFDFEIKNLKKICKYGHTKIFIEVPCIDSLKIGRRECDFLGDIIFYHYHYFSSYTLINLMNRYGFRCIYSDSYSRLIFKHTNFNFILPKNLNLYQKVLSDIKTAENKRKIFLISFYLKNLIRSISPSFYNLLVNIRNFKKIFDKNFYLKILVNLFTYFNYLNLKKQYKGIIHLHVPQCGGNSINYFLKLNFGFRLYQFDRNTNKKINSYIDNKYLIYTSHMGIDFVMKNNKIDDKFFYILNIRNPKNRLLSNYYRNKKLSADNNEEYISLEDFLEERLRSNLDNIFVRYMSGDMIYDGSYLRQNIDQKIFEKAQENLNKINFVFNIDQSKKNFISLIKVLEIKFPFSSIFSKHKNKVSDSKYPKISEKAENLLNKLTFYDTKLYNKFKD